MKYTNLGKTDIRVSRIPYSPLAGGHLSHRGWESGTKRSDTDKTIRSKYDHAKENDLEIINRVAELAERLGVSMSLSSKLHTKHTR